MNNKEILDKIKQLSSSEKRNLSYSALVRIMNNFSVNEKIELSNIIGYPVFTRLCMGDDLKHQFVLLQDGASAIIVNDQKQILLQSRTDRDEWCLPGGCQELGERFQDTIIREIKEETNLDVKEEDLILIDIISGYSRMNKYPNGDVVINNSVLYLIKNYSGSLKWNEEAKDMRFFALDSLSENLMDKDLIEAYKAHTGKKKLYKF